MDFSFTQGLLATIFFGGLAFLRPQALWVLLIISACALPSARIIFPLGIPVYVYDLLIVLIGLTFFAQVKGLRPRAPEAALLVVVVTIFISLFIANFRYDAGIRAVYVGVHAALAIFCYRLGLVLSLQRENVGALVYSTAVVAALLLTLVIFQSISLANSGIIVDFFFGDFDASDQRVVAITQDRYIRPAASHSNPNTLGAICLFLMFLQSAVIRRLWGRLRMIAVINCFMLIAVIGISGSRQVLLAIALGLLPLLRISGYIRKTTLSAISIAVVAVTVIGIYTSDQWFVRLTGTVSGGQVDSNILARVIDGPIRMSQQILANPSFALFGAGYDVQKFARFSGDGVSSELASGFVSNGFLLSFYYSGIVCLLAWFGFWWSVLRRSVGRNLAASKWSTSFCLAGLFIFVADNHLLIAEELTLLYMLGQGYLYGLGTKVETSL